ncbi:MAG TPA: hypothetical protein PK129_18060, partial [Cellvibrionaceae bacterium]|nr:hypothetical protein [Cellvibrionaceae bacterium]
KGGKSVEIVANVSGKTTKQTVKYLNKPDPLKPYLLGINPGVYAMVFDPVATRIAKVSLASANVGLWEDYLTNSQLKGENILFDFNSSNQHAYTVVNGNQLVAAGIAKSSPADYYGGSLPNPVNITFDSTNKRLLVLSKGSEKYSVYSVATAQSTGTDIAAFANGKTSQTNSEAANTTFLRDLPANAVQGTYRQFNFHRVSKTFVIADERDIGGVKRTVIQGFSEADGSKKFEVEVGANISNMAIYNTDGIIYVAENKSSLMTSKLKAINIATGSVTDMGEIKGGTTIADYSDVRIDNAKKKLYVGDAVGDAIYEIDLTTKVVTELNLTAAQPQVGETVDN